MKETPRDATPITVREWSYDDPLLPSLWDSLLARSDTKPVTQSLEWHQAWWASRGRGRLLLLAAELAAEPVAIAPLFADHGMVFFVGAGEADCHDMLGVVHDPAVLASLLATAQALAPGFLGIRLHFLPEASRTAAALRMTADHLGWNVVHERLDHGVLVDLAADPAAARQAVGRSMRKTEDALHRAGDFEVRRIETAGEALPLLPSLFEMHIARWKARGVDSIFLDPARRDFLERWVALSADRGWLRMIHLLWNGVSLGIDLNWHYRGTQHSGPWAFDTAHQKHSPGQVLLRQAVLMALESGMHTYDLGLGDEAYKFRLPCRVVSCETVGLYPPS